MVKRKTTKRKTTKRKTRDVYEGKAYKKSGDIEILITPAELKRMKRRHEQYFNE